jgi:hypothetical protein
VRINNIKAQIVDLDNFIAIKFRCKNKRIKAIAAAIYSALLPGTVALKTRDDAAGVNTILSPGKTTAEGDPFFKTMACLPFLTSTSPSASNNISAVAGTNKAS